MPVCIDLCECGSNLFAASKWWGDPDMPSDMKYPVMKVTEDGEEYEYPLTFICQINCEEAVRYGTASEFLPAEGMLYFFAAIDEYIGFDAPFHFGDGEWPKGTVAVKYTKSVNMETFETVSVLGDDDGSCAAEPLAISFSDGQEANPGDLVLLPEVLGEVPEGAVCLLQFSAAKGFAGQVKTCPENAVFRIFIPADDLRNRKWNRVRMVMSRG